METRVHPPEEQSLEQGTWQATALCSRTVMEKGLANSLSHAAFTGAPCPIASNPPTLGGLDHWHPGEGRDAASQCWERPLSGGSLAAWLRGGGSP